MVHMLATGKTMQGFIVRSSTAWMR